MPLPTNLGLQILINVVEAFQFISANNYMQAKMETSNIVIMDKRAYLISINLIKTEDRKDFDKLYDCVCNGYFSW
jgi:hypothetical protein